MTLSYQIGCSSHESGIIPAYLEDICYFFCLFWSFRTSTAERVWKRLHFCPADVGAIIWQFPYHLCLRTPQKHE